MNDVLLAWAGWQLRMPKEWQPLKLTGTPSKGNVIVGDSTCAVFMVKWDRVRQQKRPFDGSQWVAARFKKLGLHAAEDPPANAFFSACGWARDVQTEEEKATTYWFGYSEPAQLLLGITVNGVLPEEQREVLVQQVLPTIRVTSSEDATMWAMYDVSFTSPAGFELSQKHLFSGDMALEFARGKCETLLLRQVYPGELALQRRAANAWLESYPFKEHRRTRDQSVSLHDWQHEKRKELSGVERSAWKRLPSPLGWCAPRRTYALAVHDSRRDRLLVAEHMTAAQPDNTMCAVAIDEMNDAGVPDAG